MYCIRSFVRSPIWLFVLFVRSFTHSFIFILCSALFAHIWFCMLVKPSYNQSFYGFDYRRHLCKCFSSQFFSLSFFLATKTNYDVRLADMPANSQSEGKQVKLNREKKPQLVNGKQHREIIAEGWKETHGHIIYVDSVEMMSYGELAGIVLIRQKSIEKISEKMNWNEIHWKLDAICAIVLCVSGVFISFVFILSHFVFFFFLYFSAFFFFPSVVVFYRCSRSCRGLCATFTSECFVNVNKINRNVSKFAVCHTPPNIHIFVPFTYDDAEAADDDDVLLRIWYTNIAMHKTTHRVHLHIRSKRE